MTAYFVNGLLNTEPTVIEDAMYERVKVFAALAVPAKIITMDFSPQWRTAAEQAGVAHEQVMSIFDWLQHVPELPVAPLPLSNFHALDDCERSLQNNRYYYRKAGQLVAVLRPTKDGAVSTINFYNEQHQVIRHDVYDEHGFRSQAQYYQSKQMVAADYFTPTGALAVRQQFGDETVTTVPETGAHYATLDDFNTAMLKLFVKPGDFVLSERREYDQAVFNLPGGVHRGYRLYNATMAITPKVTDLVLARHYMPLLPEAKVFDEYADDAQLQKGWKRILLEEGVL